MTLTMFLTLLTSGSLVSSLLTEALKKGFKNMSSNLIALINAAVVGLLGTIAAYILLDVPFTIQNITCLLLMVVCVWLGSMLGYDKVAQTLSQLKK